MPDFGCVGSSLSTHARRVAVELRALQLKECREGDEFVNY